MWKSWTEELDGQYRGSKEWKHYDTELLQYPTGRIHIFGAFYNRYGDIEAKK